MKFKRIFGPKKCPSKEGLYALILNEGKLDEYRKLIKAWVDAEQMLNWCQRNLEDIQRAFGRFITAEDAAEELMEEAENLFELIYRLGTQQFPNTNLQQIFKPLNNKEPMFAE